MIIDIAKGTGTASTTLAAFDAALYDTGIANFNLVRLSSVIPPSTELRIHDDKVPTVAGEWGDKLYVVMADYRSSTPEEEAWAGIGWVVDASSGKGLFVEHEGASESYVRESINQSLQELMTTRGVDFGEISMVVQGVKCHSTPVCAMVVAVYQSDPWR